MRVLDEDGVVDMSGSLVGWAVQALDQSGLACLRALPERRTRQSEPERHS
jgi:hypothetical protein